MEKQFSNASSYFALNKSISVVNYLDKGIVTRKAYKMLKHDGNWNQQRKVMSIFKTIKLRLINKYYWIVPKGVKKLIKRNNSVYKG